MASVPEPVACIAGLMSSFGRPWCLAGGWAADAWLGRETRDHLDVDVVVFEEDQQALFEHLDPGWDLVAHDAQGVSTQPWEGQPLILPAHLHARPRSPGREDLMHWITPPFKPLRDGRDLDVNFNSLHAGAWLLNTDPPIIVPVADAIRDSSWGLPTIAPELVVFYKATSYHGEEWFKPRPHDLSDSEALTPLLTEDRRAWLRAALGRVPHYPWADELTL